jgi:3'-phosphoadenosine 5'-phosphosulfate (PAPS) 3'-phosphatase
VILINFLIKKITLNIIYTYNIKSKIMRKRTTNTKIDVIETAKTNSPIQKKDVEIEEKIVRGIKKIFSKIGSVLSEIDDNDEIRIGDRKTHYIVLDSDEPTETDELIEVDFQNKK